MHIGKLSKSIPASFEYAFLDDAGEYCEETVNVKVKRLSFRETAAKEFQEKFDAIKDDTAKLAEVLPTLVDWWDLFEHDLEKLDESGEPIKIPIPVTSDFLMELPSAFVMQLAACVMETLNANPQKPASLEDGSAQKGKRASQAAKS